MMAMCDQCGGQIGPMFERDGHAPGCPAYAGRHIGDLTGGVEEYEAGEREYARDRFAAAALMGVLASLGENRPAGPVAAGLIASDAFDIADAMLAERERRRGK